MAQLDFEQNWPALSNGPIAFTTGTVNFIPIYINDSLSWKTLNVGLANGANSSATLTLSAGLYSLIGSTLTLLNSLSGTQVVSPAGIALTISGYLSASATSASSNILKGQYWLGLLIATSNHSSLSYVGATRMTGVTAPWPSFVQGRLTASSTSSLPASVATSNLDMTGISMANPTILLTA